MKSETPDKNAAQETPRNTGVKEELLKPSDQSAIVDGKKEGELDESFYVASQWTLMWWKLRRHKLAMISGVIIILLYLIAIFADFLGPYNYDIRHNNYVFCPPQSIRIFDESGLSRPFVYELEREVDRETLQRLYVPDKTKKHYVHFFVKGEPYKFWGMWETDIHLFGVSDEKNATMFLFGTDRMGRDVFSRVLYGARISLSIGLFGVILSLILGIMIGGVSGYYGGTIDMIIQRIIEILRSIPTIPLWLGLSASLPPNWPIIRVYFGITIILSLIGWTGLARVVRGKFLALREEDFAMAARIAGAGEGRVIFKHLLPSFLSHIIVSITVSIPRTILGETSLSFLGLGLRSPAVSWGVLLQEAQNVQTVALSPWLMIPVVFVIGTVLTFNFLGDGLRDAADPYSR